MNLLVYLKKMGTHNKPTQHVRISKENVGKNNVIDETQPCTYFIAFREPL